MLPVYRTHFDSDFSWLAAPKKLEAKHSRRPLRGAAKRFAFELDGSGNRFVYAKDTVRSRPKLNCGRRRCLSALVPVCESEVTRIGIAMVGSHNTVTVFASLATRPQVCASSNVRPALTLLSGRSSPIWMPYL